MLDLQPLPPWQTERARALATRAEAGRLPTALLLVGPAGAGKRRLAATVIRRFACVDRPAGSVDGCGACGPCQQLASGSHPDLVAATPEEGKQTVSVDGIREFSRRLYLTPQSALGRVGYIAQADRMTVSAANALLKTLEEPPATAHLILVADRPAALPATIRSRCEMLRAGVTDRDAAAHWLAEHHGDLDAAQRERLIDRPLLATAHAERAATDQSLGELADAVWTQRTDPVAAAAKIADEALPHLAPLLFQQLRGHLASGLRDTDGPSPTIWQRVADANAAALHLQADSQAQLRLLAETQLIEWARAGRAAATAKKKAVGDQSR